MAARFTATHCPKCEQAYPPLWHETRRLEANKRISETLQQRKANGLAVGAPPKIDRAQVVTLYKTGHTIRNVATLMNCTEETVIHILKASKVLKSRVKKSEVNY